MSSKVTVSYDINGDPEVSFNIALVRSFGKSGGSISIENTCQANLGSREWSSETADIIINKLNNAEKLITGIDALVTDPQKKVELNNLDTAVKKAKSICNQAKIVLISGAFNRYGNPTQSFVKSRSPNIGAVRLSLKGSVLLANTDFYRQYDDILRLSIGIPFGHKLLRLAPKPPVDGLKADIDKFSTITYQTIYDKLKEIKTDIPPLGTYISLLCLEEDITNDKPDDLPTTIASMSDFFGINSSQNNSGTVFGITLNDIQTVGGHTRSYKVRGHTKSDKEKKERLLKEMLSRKIQLFLGHIAIFIKRMDKTLDLDKNKLGGALIRKLTEYLSTKETCDFESMANAIFEVILEKDTNLVLSDHDKHVIKERHSQDWDTLKSDPVSFTVHGSWDEFLISYSDALKEEHEVVISSNDVFRDESSPITKKTLFYGIEDALVRKLEPFLVGSESEENKSSAAKLILQAKGIIGLNDDDIPTELQKLDESGCTKFYNAFKRGNKEICTLLLIVGAGKPIDLQKAINEEDLPLIDILLTKGNFDLNNNYRDCKKLLELAIQKNNPEIVQKIINAGVTGDQELLRLAIQKGNPVMVQKILLRLAIQKGNPVMVQKIIDTGVTCDQELLRLAIQKGNPEMVQKIIDTGVTCDKELLGYAIYIGDARVVSCLINKSNPELPTYGQKTLVFNFATHTMSMSLEANSLKTLKVEKRKDSSSELSYKVEFSPT